MSAAIVLGILLSLPGTAGPAQAEARPIVTALMVHGNHTTPDAEVVRLAGVLPGQAFTPTTIADVTARLEQSGRFRHVDVRQRFTSFSDPNAVLLVIVVEERAGISIDAPSPGPLRRFGASTMWLPVFAYEDGYGLTYGARLGFVDLLGPSTRIAVPLTWGGERRASVAVERTFTRGPVSRVEVSGGTWRREHPPSGEGQRRTFGGLRVERAFGSSFRLGARGETASVDFGGAHESLQVAGVEAVLDTRRDPSFARNAVYASLGWDRVWHGSSDTWRVNTDVRGYLGLPRSIVLVARVQNSSVGDSLPAYEEQYLGGTSNLRGFRLGYRAGDQLTAASMELRLPITSPVHLGRFGVAVFVDRGAAYDAHVPVRSATFDTGIGAGIFATLPILSFRMDVAHGLDAGTRVHVTLGARF